MLEIKSISKSYKTGNFIQVALNKVSVKFRKKEFVSVLGASGSGKTTLLNMIGGLDRYDDGDLIINNKSTKKFREKDWNAYRNNCIGFIFQNYNLISHISILENVEMGMTLSGVKRKRKKALDALDKVGLLDHKHKKPNQLSGGQMQRVAIARALANDPEIILADEPTGALDSKTSKQIMKLIKEIAKEKLVIMVTHNKELAEEYSTRILELKDGKLISDSNPVKKDNDFKDKLNIKKTAMKFTTAMKLSFNNIKTKKGRTALTAFASSIGIIGIALILSLSNGFKIEIDNFEKDSLSDAPIVITEQAMNMDQKSLEKMSKEQQKLKKYPNTKKIYGQEDVVNQIVHKNNITKDYINYLEKLDKKYISGISYQKSTALNVINYSEKEEYNLVDTKNSNVEPWTVLPDKINNNKSIIDNSFDVIAGKIDYSKPGLVIQVNNKNQVYKSTLKQLGFDNEEVSFEDIMKKELKVVLNDDYYKRVGNYFIPSTNYKELYNNKNCITLKVQAIIRGKKDKELIANGTGVIYTNSLVEEVIKRNKDSEIVRYQQDKDYNILTNQTFDESKDFMNTKELALSYLGADSIPAAIYIYPKNFNAKDNITKYLDKYNKEKDVKDEIKYTDTAKMISTLSGNIMNAITIVLIAFSSISLIVSSIMIGIITYISVLERTKEIGILRALGARRKDIKRVFNAETFIIGIFSGGLGILIARLLIIPTNIVIENMSNLKNVAKLNPIHAIILIVISVVLTIIGGLIPASIASKKDPVEALRTE
ncbi:MAG: ATP-binding cassette domain-containing protein [Bacilli bacterium]|nr:ATP-binding cassette domain-containing protein [Bacilli bacterium]